MTDLPPDQLALRDSIILSGRRLMFAQWLYRHDRLGKDDDEPDPNGRIPPWRLVAPPPKPDDLTVETDEGGGWDWLAP